VSNAETRAEKLVRTITSKKIDAFLVTDISNIRYLTGFTGSSAFALVTHSGSFFFTDFRYIEQCRYEVKGFELGMERGDRIAVIADMIKALGIKRLGFESEITYDFYMQLTKLNVKLTAQKELVQGMRLIKDAHELACMKKAISRAEEAFLATKPVIRAGVTEKAVALKLEEEMKKRGCRRAAFDIIVASGKHSSLPHAGQTDKRIEKGDLILIDWGGEADGYYSDMSRTLLMSGEDLDQKKKIYNIVDQAREKAILAVCAGRGAFEVDAAARDFISDSGFGDYFGHGTGHGIGLEVHEDPRISWVNKRKLEDGMVFSIEPGIYLPGVGGVRIEDLVLVAGRGETLTSLSRGLEIID
jgi:Xaa-Pro aminopeptidase